jgi:hypothetical protein
MALVPRVPRACNATTAQLTTERLLRLAFYSRDLMRALMKARTLDFDYVQNGKLVVHTDPGAFESARASWISSARSAASNRRSIRRNAWSSSPRSRR